MAEREGFEPSVGRTYGGFQDRCLRPLSHLSDEMPSIIICSFKLKNQAKTVSKHYPGGEDYTNVRPQAWQNELLLGNQHDAKAKIVDLEIRVATETIRNTAVLGAAEPAAAADDVQLAFRAKRIHDTVAIGVRQDFALPFAGI